MLSYIRRHKIHLIFYCTVDVPFSLFFSFKLLACLRQKFNAFPYVGDTCPSIRRVSTTTLCRTGMHETSVLRFFVAKTQHQQQLRILGKEAELFGWGVGLHPQTQQHERCGRFRMHKQSRKATVSIASKLNFVLLGALNNVHSRKVI